MAPEPAVEAVQDALAPAPAMAEAPVVPEEEEALPFELPVLEEDVPFAQADIAEESATERAVALAPETRETVLTLPEEENLAAEASVMAPLDLQTMADLPVLDEEVSQEDKVANGLAELVPVADMSTSQAIAVDEHDPVQPDNSLEDVVSLPIEPAAFSPATEPSPVLGAEQPAGVHSIPLDSLPHGVLGGSRPVVEPVISPAMPSMLDLIREAELTLTEERRQQAEETMAAQAAEAAAASPAQETTPAVIRSRRTSAQAVRPVEIVNIAGLAASSAPAPAAQSQSLPAVRKSYVTLVDEATLIDSLYDKILPRMRVELSLWLQDALEYQAKQMMAGVMKQWQEDYDMLFSETLRASLRQAIAEMSRDDQGEGR